MRKQIFIIVLGIIICGLTTGCEKSSNKTESYLSGGTSNYDLTCTNSEEYAPGKTLTQTFGLKEMKDNNYISYSIVYVISNDDGKSMEENDEVIEEIKTSLINAGYLDVNSKLQDGKAVINASSSNYDYSKASDAKKDFTSLGYTCK